mmetsp:Transcript_28567/g.53921  ORF Transcript_28567/g.53921 Transcript_28567/m.53921 type:complete len:487 (+) Transcript_28567:361-1821(+)
MGATLQTADSKSTEVAIRADLLACLQVWVQDAVRAVCSSHEEFDVSKVIQVPKEQVRPCAKAGRGDFQCHLAVALFRRLKASRALIKDADATLPSRRPFPREAVTSANIQLDAAQMETKASHVLTKPNTQIHSANSERGQLTGCDGVWIGRWSEYGVLYSRLYISETHFAEAIVEALPCSALEVLADIRVMDGGLIVFTTRLHLEKQRASNLLLCPDCGRFFAAGRGLRDHQQIKHRQTYKASVAIVAENSLQITAVRADSADPDLLEQWIHEANARKLARTAIVPLLEAARDGNLMLVQDLISQGCDASITADRHGSSALLWAAGSGHLHVCKYLVDFGNVNPLRTMQKDGRNALHWAARNGHLEVCKWLVDWCKLSVDQPTLDGTTAFHWAVWQGHIGICRWLVEEENANFTSLNSFGCNAIQWAAQTSNLEMCRCERYTEASSNGGSMRSHQSVRVCESTRSYHARDATRVGRVAAELSSFIV